MEYENRVLLRSAISALFMDMLFIRKTSRRKLPLIFCWGACVLVGLSLSVSLSMSVCAYGSASVSAPASMCVCGGGGGDLCVCV